VCVVLVLFAPALCAPFFNEENWKQKFFPKKKFQEKIHNIYINTRTRARTSEKGSGSSFCASLAFFFVFFFFCFFFWARARGRERERERSKIGGFALIIECNTYKHR
jgi:hypothetical protein